MSLSEDDTKEGIKKQLYYLLCDYYFVFYMFDNMSIDRIAHAGPFFRLKGGSDE